jgi:oxygen-independent coproporphyrinogen III oxidase
LASSERVVSLYVHVPFCTGKCLYCDFFSVPAHAVGEADVSAVVGQTVRQAHALLDAAGADARVPTVFVGGGTPTILPLAELERLLGAFSRLGAREWTVEANPETLSGDFLDACAGAGVTRISLGVQSIHERHLRTLGRRATRAQTLDGIRLLRDRWRGDASIDLITGIPGQTAADVLEELSLLDGSWPGHVSLYQLTLEEGTGLAGLVESGTVRPNGTDVDDGLWFTGRDGLEERGYRRYEVSNFCLPGSECRHNLRYWTLEPYAGAGPGAVSTVPASWAVRLLGVRGAGAPREGVARLSSPRSIHGFLEAADRHWGMDVESVPPRSFILETLMMGLRLADGVSADAFQRRFGLGFHELFPGLWDRWVGRGLAQADADRLRLSWIGLDLLERLLGEVAAALPDAPLERVRLRWP